MSTAPYKTRREAASYLRQKGIPITEATLATKASRGDGPMFVKFGRRALYAAEWLDAWVHEESVLHDNSAA